MASEVRQREQVPAELLAAVIDGFDPIQVILFGSRARGEAGSDSDWDLLVVVDDQAADGLGHPEPPSWPGAATVIPYSRAKFEADRDRIGTLANMADEDGAVVWRRSSVPIARARRRRPVSPLEQWQVALRWLARAEQDLEVAQTLLALGDRQLDNAAFHLQQAAEKVLKGMLAAGARPFRKAHGLGELATWVAELHPDLAPELTDLDPYTTWAAAGRYPDARTSVPITRATVETLLARCTTLLARARALDPARRA
jgi:HEPN domain-containing protein